MACSRRLQIAVKVQAGGALKGFLRRVRGSPSRASSELLRMPWDLAQNLVFTKRLDPASCEEGDHQDPLLLDWIVLAACADACLQRGR